MGKDSVWEERAADGATEEVECWETLVEGTESDAGDKERGDGGIEIEGYEYC